MPSRCFEFSYGQAEGQIVFLVGQHSPGTPDSIHDGLTTVKVAFQVKAQRQFGALRDGLVQAVRQVCLLVRASGVGHYGWHGLAPEAVSDRTRTGVSPEPAPSRGD